MESGSGPREPFGPGSPGYGPGGADPSPQPAPGGPQSPAPGPQAPAPGADSLPPAPPPTPAPPAGPQSPGPQAPGIPSPEPPSSPGYGGPVPPGGWQQAPPALGSTPPQGALAGWGARLGAVIIDGLIVLVPTLVLLGLAGVGVFAAGGDDTGVGAVIVGAVLTILLYALIALFYAPLLMMRGGQNNGQTWGKQILGIRVVRNNGQPFSFGSAAFREVLIKSLAVGIASSIIPFLPWFLNYFWPLWDDENRALHDMACSTHVVRAS